MTWCFHYEEGDFFAECTFRDVTTAEELKEVTARGIALQKETGVLCFLMDARETDFDAMNADVYQLPAREYPEYGVDKRTRIAVVRPRVERERSAGAQIVDFYVLACTNRYWKAKAFTSRAEAVEWLLEG